MSGDEIKADLEEFFALVITCLNEAKIKYVVVGAIASIVWGRPRTTMDVEVVIDATKVEIQSFARILEVNGFIYGTKDILVAIKENSIATILHEDFPYKIDIQGVYEPLNERTLSNRIFLKVFGQEAYVEKPEDLIIAKLRYDRSTDFDDAKAILIRQNTKLNYKYLERIARQENLLDDLKTLFDSVAKYKQQNKVQKTD
ncbi:MAG: hypothetical protein ACFE95_00015 [Candidatus Hodarchaeota archaeon]